MGDLPIIEGARIRLRPLCADDAPALFVLHGDAAVMRYWSTAAWTSPAAATAHLARAAAAQAQGGLPWACALRATNALIGAVTLHNLNPTHRRAELGYALARGCWGQGLAGEALRLALGHAFDGLALERIEADTDPRNLPSRRLLERLGFVLEGTMRRRWFVNEEWCDTSWYGLLRTEFAR